MHLAASQGTPCVALFGAFNQPRQWYPFGANHSIIYEPRGIREIGAEKVGEAVLTVLECLKAQAGKRYLPVIGRAASGV
jgi:ADP-heptose:LPS heptosyltransferase